MFSSCSRPGPEPARVIVLSGTNVQQVSAAVMARAGASFLHAGTHFSYLPGSLVPAASQFPDKAARLQRLRLIVAGRAGMGLSTLLEAPADPWKLEAHTVAGALHVPHALSVLVHTPLTAQLAAASSPRAALKTLAAFAITYTGSPAKTPRAVDYMTTKQFIGALTNLKTRFGDAVFAKAAAFGRVLGFAAEHRGMYLSPRLGYDLVVEDRHPAKAAEAILRRAKTATASVLAKSPVAPCASCSKHAPAFVPCDNCLRAALRLSGSNLDGEAAASGAAAAAAPAAAPSTPGGTTGATGAAGETGATGGTGGTGATGTAADANAAAAEEEADYEYYASAGAQSYYSGAAAADPTEGLDIPAKALDEFVPATSGAAQAEADASGAAQVYGGYDPVSLFRKHKHHLKKRMESIPEFTQQQAVDLLVNMPSMLCNASAAAMPEPSEEDFTLLIDLLGVLSGVNQALWAQESAAASIPF